MSQSIRPSRATETPGYSPVPLRPEGQESLRRGGAPRRALVFWAVRQWRWLGASAHQSLHRAMRPVVSALKHVDNAWQDAGQWLWTLLYTFAVMTARGAAHVQIGFIGFSRASGRNWHNVLIVLSRRFFRRMTLVFLFSGACLFFIIASFYTLGLEVILNGKSIGFVASSAEFDRAVDNVSQRASEILKYPYYPNPDVAYQYSVVDRKAIFNQAEVEEQLFSQIADIKKLYVLTVDDVVITATSDLTGLQAVLDGILQSHNMNGTVDTVNFVQDVQITYQWTDAALEKPLQDISTLLNSKRDARYYQVQAGDTFSGIALRNGMSEADLQAYNRNVDPADLTAVPKLLIQNPLPFLSVETRQRVYYDEIIPYSSVTVKDDKFYVGESKVRVQGMNGMALITADLRFVDGEEYGRVEVSRDVSLAPLQEVIAEGTRKMKPKLPTGTLTQPYFGTITSEYGWRDLFGYRVHEGLDIAGPIGSPIVAADGGEVIFSGTRNGYGLCIMIDHGGGLVTLYGHCSKLLVEEGQIVSKGELIAKVGATGRVTGPHLHFETRVNGESVDPRNYIG